MQLPTIIEKPWEHWGMDIEVYYELSNLYLEGLQRAIFKLERQDDGSYEYTDWLIETNHLDFDGTFMKNFFPQCLDDVKEYYLQRYKKKLSDYKVLEIDSDVSNSKFKVMNAELVG